MADPLKNLLVIAPNWLGDAVMALPALQLWRPRHAGARVTVLSKPGLSAFWGMSQAVDAVFSLPPGVRGTFRIAREIRRGTFAAVWILPNAFRSAFIPWLGGIPDRRGLRGHWRRWLLTACTPPPFHREPGVPLHQAWEYAAIFGLPDDIRQLPPPRLCVAPAELEHARRDLGLDRSRPWIGIVPGAARGPSKRWPADAFAACARTLAERLPNLGLAVCGTEAERELCHTVSVRIGERAINLAGRTDLTALAAVFRLCDAVICNDSGGMHLASALDTPVAAIYGLTDPARTGPLGARQRILRPPGIQGARRIARASQAATRALRGISPDAVAAAVLDLLPDPLRSNGGIAP